LIFSKTTGTRVRPPGGTANVAYWAALAKPAVCMVGIHSPFLSAIQLFT
jgi:hypothetical protein